MKKPINQREVIDDILVKVNYLITCLTSSPQDRVGLDDAACDVIGTLIKYAPTIKIERDYEFCEQNEEEFASNLWKGQPDSNPYIEKQYFEGGKISD